MSFSEKSAWGLLIGLLIVSAFYFPKAFTVAGIGSSPASAVALVALIGVGTVVLVVIEVAYHTVVALGSPRNARVDERDRLIDLKAERNGSLVLGLSLFYLIGWVLVRSIWPVDDAPGALAVVVFIMLAITLAEIAKLASQIWFYRRGA